MLKAELERIWADRKCRSPGHLLWWNESVGYKEADKLYYCRGRAMGRRRRRRREYSYISRNYGLVWHMNIRMIRNASKD